MGSVSGGSNSGTSNSGTSNNKQQQATTSNNVPIMERLMFQSTGVCSAVIQGISWISVPTNEDEDVAEEEEEEDEEEEDEEDEEERRSPLLPRLLLSLAPP